MRLIRTRAAVRLAGPVLLLFPPTLAAQQSEVPLVRYRDARWPSGPPIGNTAGASFLDYDGDGFSDFFVNINGRLWHNEGGVTWSLAADLDAVQPPIGSRYGSACGDYDNDGLPDIATEPRQNFDDDCFHLLHNLGGGPNFVDVATDPSIVLGQPCEMNAETGCWADVDEDGDLDLWVTAYPDPEALDGGGHRFWENLGPSGPGGAYRLELRTEEAGLGLPGNTSRPEGAQILDIDRDGDVDAFANNTVYQNISETSPRFVALLRSLTGITLAGTLDEGALFADHDMDGDQDLFVLYQGQSNRLWESRGDGTFFDARNVIDRPGRGASQGSSAEDWDLDGDLDLTTGNVLRRNLRVETGQLFLRIAEHDIPDSDLQLASPAWADWDEDGDPDVILANWRASSFLYRNTTYDRDTPPLERRTVRIRVVRDDPDLPRGLETEFGATVEIRVHDDTSGLVRRRFVASSHGYLQQSEYELTMALPAGTDARFPAMGVHFDLLVDFPGLASRGILRVDPTLNRALGGIHLGKLADREITVFRSGKVVLDGVAFPPRADVSPRLTTTTGGLALAAIGAPLPDPVPAPGESWFVGAQLDTALARGPLHAEELLLDGQLDLAVLCKGEPFNAALWDASGPGSPRRVWQATFATSSRNRRSYFPVSFTLQPRRVYRVVCRVSELRGSPIAGPVFDEPVLTEGGLSFQDLDPCSGLALRRAEVDPSRVYLALRFRELGVPAPQSPAAPLAPAAGPGRAR